MCLSTTPLLCCRSLPAPSLAAGAPPPRSSNISNRLSKQPHTFFPSRNKLRTGTYCFIKLLVFTHGSASGCRTVLQRCTTERRAGAGFCCVPHTTSLLFLQHANHTEGGSHRTHHGAAPGHGGGDGARARPADPARGRWLWRGPGNVILPTPADGMSFAFRAPDHPDAVTRPRVPATTWCATHAPPDRLFAHLQINSVQKQIAGGVGRGAANRAVIGDETATLQSPSPHHPDRPHAPRGAH